MKIALVLSYPLSAQQRLGSDWADAQADLSSLGTQSVCQFVGFVKRWLISAFFEEYITTLLIQNISTESAGLTLRPGSEPSDQDLHCSPFCHMLLTNFQGHQPFGSREDFLRFLYEHGGHVTWTI